MNWDGAVVLLEIERLSVKWPCCRQPHLSRLGQTQTSSSCWKALQAVQLQHRSAFRAFAGAMLR